MLQRNTQENRSTATCCSTSSLPGGFCAWKPGWAKPEGPALLLHPHSLWGWGRGAFLAACCLTLGKAISLFCFTFPASKLEIKMCLKAPGTSPNLSSGSENKAGKTHL